MSAIILDTETSDINGFPIEIAYMAFALENGKAIANYQQVFDEYYSIAIHRISWAAMAVHHITHGDIDSKPHYTCFRLPKNAQYIIGHNIDFDVTMVAKADLDVKNLKKICTLALSRITWPTESHTLSALCYMLDNGSNRIRDRIRGAHNAAQDVKLTAFLLEKIIAIHDVQSLEDLYQLSEYARLPQTMPWGKYKGTLIAEIPTPYVEWVLAQDKADDYLKRALEAAHGTP